MFLVGFVFSFFRSSGVVRNYQAKLIRDFLPLGVVQKQMKCPMNGFVLHVNNILENQFSTKKTPSIAAEPYFPAEHTINLKHWSQRHATLRDYFIFIALSVFISVYKLFSHNMASQL